MNNTITGNKLIGIFDGWYQKELPKNGDINWFHPVYSTKITNSVTIPTRPENFKYHTSWDWLMPVVEKISRIEFDRHEQELPFGDTEIVIETHYPRTFGMLNKEGKPMFRFNCGTLHTADTLIEAAWLAVVDFIQGYNQLTP